MDPTDLPPDTFATLTATLADRARSVTRMAELFAVLHGELRSVARKHRQSLNASATLDTTGLVHEAYLKLSAAHIEAPTDPAHFFALAAQSMRQIIIDRARRTLAGKRGEGAAHVPLEDITLADTDEQVSVQALAVHQALAQLEQASPRLAQTVVLRFFGGLTEEEVGEVLGRDPATVRRDWTKARAWLFRALSDPAASGS
ncbi:MAG: sigma-70 family RNA polymerase sigma factor [Xanthomonadales bacterium]|nr:sigma-70 family RNA polymerase sigma factor [Xanthomonadales bacterium]